jgi:flagellar biosynthesis/type III secretory pathway M-ring protein FliF/YscJ
MRLSALAVGACLALAGCGSSDSSGEIPPENANAMLAALGDLQGAAGSDSCDSAEQAVVRFQEQVGALPDEELRSTLEEATGRLNDLVNQQVCEPTGTTDTTTTEEVVEPTTTTDAVEPTTTEETTTEETTTEEPEEEAPAPKPEPQGPPEEVPPEEPPGQGGAAPVPDGGVGVGSEGGSG